jgi:hypothetical protein
VLLSVIVETAVADPSAKQWGAYVKPLDAFLTMHAGPSPCQGVLLGFDFFRVIACNGRETFGGFHARALNALPDGGRIICPALKVFLQRTG